MDIEIAANCIAQNNFRRPDCPEPSRQKNAITLPIIERLKARLTLGSM